jgi:hypothetical protein
MKVLLEPIPQGWRASTMGPLNLSSEGVTEAESLSHLRSKILKRLQEGAKIVELNLDEVLPKHPASEFAGAFKDNPLFEEWQQGIAEYRRQQDERDL